MISVLEILLVT